MGAIILSAVGTKGGIGKTSLVKFFGITKAMEGKKVLLIDLCQNSDIATRLGYDRKDFMYDTYSWISGKVPFQAVIQHDEETGLDFVPASSLVEKILEYAQEKRPIRQEWVIKEKIDEIKHMYDYIVFDNHPTETNRMMIMSLVASDIALVPLIMDLSGAIATVRTVDIIKQLQNQGVNLKYICVPMAVDFSKGFGKDLEKIKHDLEKDEQITSFSRAIRYSSVIPKAGLRGQVINSDNQYVQNVMEDYKVVAEEIDQLVVKA